MYLPCSSSLHLSTTTCTHVPSLFPGYSPQSIPSAGTELAGLTPRRPRAAPGNTAGLGCRDTAGQVQETGKLRY